LKNNNSIMKALRIAVAAIGCLGFSSAFSPGSRVFRQRRHTASLIKRASSPKVSDPLRPVVKGETLLIPFSENEVELGDGVVNDGLYSWIAPYLSLGGYQAGATLMGGMASTEVSAIYSEEEKEGRRKRAAEDMVNISNEERARRRELSNNFYIATAVYAAISSILLDDGSFFGHVWRFAIFLPLSSAYALQLSADRGL
jgi:hypothetical protein